jgi:hypothetical protein
VGQNAKEENKHFAHQQLNLKFEFLAAMCYNESVYKNAQLRFIKEVNI